MQFLKSIARTLPIIWRCFAPGQTPAARLETVEAFVRARFPDIPRLSCERLSQWMNQTNPRLLLLDVRRRDEYEVSHLPGAVWADPASGANAWRDKIPAGTRVVAYCSAGYRSAKFVRALLQSGAPEAFNLEGSIFRWANEGRPLERDGKPAADVHPFHSLAKRFLNPRS